MTSIYNQSIKLPGSQAQPPFESAAQQEAVWSRQWGCVDDVGQIRLCLMYRPGEEMNVIETDYDKLQLNGGGIHRSTGPLTGGSVD